MTGRNTTVARVEVQAVAEGVAGRPAPFTLDDLLVKVRILIRSRAVVAGVADAVAVRVALVRVRRNRAVVAIVGHAVAVPVDGASAATGGAEVIGRARLRRRRVRWTRRCDRWDEDALVVLVAVGVQVREAIIVDGAARNVLLRTGVAGIAVAIAVR